MEVLRIICTVIMLLSAVALIVIVLFQSGKSAGLSGAIAGNSDNFMSKNKNRSWDAKLATSTKWVAAVWLITTFALSLL